MALIKRYYEPNQDGVQVEETDIEAMRGEIKYRLVEARAVLEAKTAEARDANPRGHFHTPRYELGYVHALEWMLDTLADEEPDEAPGPELTDEQLAQLET